MHACTSSAYTPANEIVNNKKLFKVDAPFPLIIVQTKYHSEEIFITIAESEGALSLQL